MRFSRFLLAALLVAPLVVAQEDPCPPTFPPDACEDSGNAAGVTTAATPPPNCSPCFTIDTFSSVWGTSCLGGCDRNCQASTGGATQFMLIVADPGGPPPSVFGVYTTETDGSCTRDDTNGTLSFPAGTLDAAKLVECGATFDYWPDLAPNDTCEGVI